MVVTFTEEGKYFFVHKVVPENTQKKTSRAANSIKAVRKHLFKRFATI